MLTLILFSLLSAHSYIRTVFLFFFQLTHFLLFVYCVSSIKWDQKHLNLTLHEGEHRQSCQHLPNGENLRLTPFVLNR